MPEFCVKHFFIFCLMPSFFFRFILYFANIASRFCTMSAAITGQAFMPSYRYTRLVFAQNGWEMITVDALASSTCSSCSFVVGFVIGCIAYVITSAGLHWNNVDKRMLDAHKQVMDYFNIPMNYHNLDGLNHGIWMEHVIKTSKCDVIVFFEPDCIPLNNNFIDYIDYAYTNNSFIDDCQISFSVHCTNLAIHLL